MKVWRGPGRQVRAARVSGSSVFAPGITPEIWEPKSDISAPGLLVYFAVFFSIQLDIVSRAAGDIVSSIFMYSAGEPV